MNRRDDAANGELQLLARRAFESRTVPLEVSDEVDLNAQLHEVYAQLDAAGCEAAALRAELDALKSVSAAESKSFGDLAQRFSHLTAVVSYASLTTSVRVC